MRTQRRFIRNLLPFLTFVLTWAITVPVHAQGEDGDITSVEAVEILGDEALRELVSPVALYPDDLLAIVLPASTYPLQIVAAARYREAAALDNSLEPDEYWDESIVALLNYPEALAFLNTDLNWTWELGQAVLAQQEDVLSAVSKFRGEAYTAGNLDSDEHQVVSVENDVVTITPADEEVVYVPYYEPEEVTVYQTERVYHYYPSAYPLYYYPYSYNHRFYDRPNFWGVSSIFLLSWDNYRVNHHYQNNRFHPYYGTRYRQDHFRRTNRYHSPRAHQRRSAHRRNRHDNRHDNQHWRPNHRYAGSRPNYNDNHRGEGKHRQRHTRREAGANLAFAGEGARLNTSRQRSSVHRDLNREINGLDQFENRSSVHRPQRQSRRSNSRISLRKQRTDTQSNRREQRVARQLSKSERQTTKREHRQSHQQQKREGQTKQEHRQSHQQQKSERQTQRRAQRQQRQSKVRTQAPQQRAERQTAPRQQVSQHTKVQKPTHHRPARSKGTHKASASHPQRRSAAFSRRH